METSSNNNSASVTIVLPAFNEEQTIASTISELRQSYPEYEILVVDDGSTDNTAELAEKKGVRVVRNEVNRGYGASLKQGMRRAKGEIIVFMDADGQHDCKDIKRLVEGLKDSDMVVGARSKEDLVTIRKPGKWTLSVLADFLVGQHIPDINSGFRAFRREDGLKYLPILPNGFSLTTTLTLAMIKDGRFVKYIPIRVLSRVGGRSSVRYFHDGIKALLLILRVIMLFNPLKIFAPLSAVLLLVGGCYTVLTIIYTSNLADTSVLLLLSGLGAFLFGLLADQIANIRRGG
jgi:glycosyltransferase involved in cell wall biosynthesis